MVLHLLKADLLRIDRLRLLKPYQLLEQFVLASVKADLGEGLLGELLRVAHLEAVFHLGRVGRAVHQLQDLVSCLLALLHLRQSGLVDWARVSSRIGGHIVNIFLRTNGLLKNTQKILVICCLYLCQRFRGGPRDVVMAATKWMEV